MTRHPDLSAIGASGMPADAAVRDVIPRPGALSENRTPTARWPLRLVGAVVYLLPLGFVVASWLVAAGFPYYLDNNESVAMYVQARNLEIWDPWTYAWMSAETTDPLRSSPEHFYTHNPNGPRYVGYLLLRLGLRDLAPLLLVISLAGTLLAVILLWRLFGRPGLVVVALALALDYAGFLAWTVNTYRIWTFVCFFGLLLAVHNGRARWCGIVAFVLFQLEYGVGCLVWTAAVTLALLGHGRRSRQIVLAAGLGAALSVGLFAGQVIAFYGWDGFIAELTVTAARRGTAGEPAGLGMLLYHAWHGPFLLLAAVSRETHSPAVMIVTLLGITFAVRALLRRQGDASERFLAKVTVATLAGAVATSTVLYGYFVDGFVVSLLPISALLIAPATGVVACELRRLLTPIWRSAHLGTVSAALVLVPIVLASATRFEPPIGAGLFQRLQADYRGRTIIAPNLGPWLASDQVAFALTNGRVFRASDIDATPEDVERLDALREADGTLTYVCLDPVYVRQMGRPQVISACDVAEARMVPRGHPVVADGTGWAIIQVNREEPPAAEAALP